MGKIFQIGFNKCGTKSINALLNNNNIKTVHYNYHDKVSKKRLKIADKIIKNEKNNNKLLNGFSGVTGFTDMESFPIYIHITHYKKLYEQYPNSIFILNIRNKEKWINSRINHLNGGYLNIFKKYYKLSTKQVIKLWSDTWDKHIADVKKFFKDKPNLLLIYDIEKDDFSKLKNFLKRHGYAINSKQLPRVGKTKKK